MNQGSTEPTSAVSPAGTSVEVPAWARLEDQVGWYDMKSVAARRAYRGIKLVQLVLGAAVPVVALASVPATLTASLGATVVVLEGVQQLYQWQTNWILYRSTAEALKHERFLYLAGAARYAGPDRERVLAERLERLVSQEHATWAEAQSGADQGLPAGKDRSWRKSGPG